MNGTRDVLVVGAGIHGTYLARELLGAGLDRERLAILDRRGEFLGAFREKARACGMESMRSTYVQHVGTDPFGLETFAEARGRESELRPTPNHPQRPSLRLFLDHTEFVVDRNGLDELLETRTVTGIDRTGDALTVRTETEPLRARNVALAIGPGDRYRRPPWANGIDRVEHVWDAEEPPASRTEGETVWVIGGGVTAGQFATAACDTAGDLTLCVRGSIREATTEADPRWINWRHIEREIHSLPPGSKARCDRVRKARNDGAMPGYLAREIRETEAITIRRDEVETAAATGDGSVRLLSERGRTETVDRVVLATGFEPPGNRPLVGAIADSLGLQRGRRNLPVLDDRSLAWLRRDGRPSRLFVTGALASTSVGPLAGNVHGARRAAERIVGRLRA